MAFQFSSPVINSSEPDLQRPPLDSSFHSINPWTQFPPSVMPWTVENRPQLVRFDGDVGSDNNMWDLPCEKLKYKRKSDFDFNPKPAKVLITEEKMAAQLRNIHISNNQNEDQGLCSPLDKTECLLPTLVLSKEVQSLPTFQSDLLPESLLPKWRKPTKALVLWKPPKGSLTAQLIKNLAEESEEKDDSVNNNNTDTMEIVTGAASTSTAMDL